MTDVSAAPLVADIQPYVTALVTAVIPIAVGYGAFLLKRWTGYAATQADLATVSAVAQTKAGQMVAAASDNLAGRSITVNSPAVLSAARAMGEEMPRVVAAMGLTPGKLAEIVAGEVGKLQAKAAPTPVAIVPPTPTAEILLRG